VNRARINQFTPFEEDIRTKKQKIDLNLSDKAAILKKVLKILDFDNKADMSTLLRELNLSGIDSLSAYSNPSHSSLERDLDSTNPMIMDEFTD
jgi:hypothetical protein